MATASCLKTLRLFCFAWVSQTHTNRPPGNIWIIYPQLPTINLQMLLQESYKKRIGAEPMLLDRDYPSTSSQLQRTSGKSVQSVEKLTTQCRTTDLGGRTQTKKAKDKVQKVRFGWEKETRQKGKGQRKGTHKCQCIICTRDGWIVYSHRPTNWFFMLRNEWESGMVFG